MNAPVTAIARFLRDEDGSVLPFVAVVAVALIGATGFGVDAARLMLMHSSLQRSIDAGALSTVARLDTTAVDVQLRKFTEANFAGGSIGATLDSLTWTLSTDKKTLTVNATASAPSSLLSVLGIEKITTNAQSVIESSSEGIELALVLDNTGSMSGDGIKSLKKAANSLVDILFGDDTVGENLYVGIVPFSQTVNVGSTHTDWLKSGSLSALNWGSTSWGGCVEAQDSTTDISDTVPSSTAILPYYWKDGSGNSNNDNDWLGVGSLNSTIGPNKNCPAEVTRLTPEKAKIVSAISAMKAVGNTHVNFGAVWGWRMLSPLWRGLWGGDMATYKLPLDYNTAHMKKAAVIMTDGENTMSGEIYTAYGWLSEKKLGTSNASAAVTELNSRLANVCTAMKNAGVVIYTVAFNNPGENVQKLLKGCASQDAFYFNSPTSTALQNAFKAIGNSLSNLRVSR